MNINTDKGHRHASVFVLVESGALTSCGPFSSLFKRPPRPGGLADYLPIQCLATLFEWSANTRQIRATKKLQNPGNLPIASSHVWLLKKAQEGAVEVLPLSQNQMANINHHRPPHLTRSDRFQLHL